MMVSLIAGSAVRAVVVPGLHNKLIPWLPRFLPRSFIASQVYGRLRRWEDA